MKFNVLKIFWCITHFFLDITITPFYGEGNYIEYMTHKKKIIIAVLSSAVVVISAMAFKPEQETTHVNLQLNLNVDIQKTQKINP